MLNREVEMAVACLEVVGRGKLPMTLALAMAKCRVNLERQARYIEDLRNGLVVRLSPYVDDDGNEVKGKDLDLTHPHIEEFNKEYKELMDSEFPMSTKFDIYVRTNDEGDEEFCWTQNFKTSRVVQIAGNVVYGLLPLLNVIFIGSEDEEGTSPPD